MANEKSESKANRLTWYRDGIGVDGWSMRLSNVPTNLKETGIAATSLVATSLFCFFNKAQAQTTGTETVTFEGNRTQYKCDFTGPVGVGNGFAPGRLEIPEALENIKLQLTNNGLCQVTATPLQGNLSYDLLEQWLDLRGEVGVKFWRAVDEVKNVDLEQCINQTISQGMQAFETAAGEARLELSWFFGGAAGIAVLAALCAACYKCRDTCSSPSAKL